MGCLMVAEIVGSMSSGEVVGTMKGKDNEFSKFGKWVVRTGCEDVL